MGTLSREATLSFPFCLPSKLGSALKGRNLFPNEGILSFKSRPDFERTFITQRSKLEVTKVVLLYKKKIIAKKRRVLIRFKNNILGHTRLKEPWHSVVCLPDIGGISLVLFARKLFCRHLSLFLTV